MYHRNPPVHLAMSHRHRRTRPNFRSVLGESVLDVSRSGYYAWRNRRPSKRAQKDAMLTEKIREIHDRSRGTYGAARVHAALQDDGIRVGKKRVACLMKEAGLRGASRRKRPSTTIQEEARGQLRTSLSAILAPLGHGRPPAHRVGAQSTGHGHPAARSGRNSSSFRSGLSVHRNRFRKSVQRRWGPPLDGLGWRLLRQRHVRVLLRNPRMRTHRAKVLRDSTGGSSQGLRLR